MGCFLNLLADVLHTRLCQTGNMLRPNTVLPVWFSLGVLFLAIWVLLTQFPREGVRVINHSGEILRQVEVCLNNGQCVTRQGVWPRDAWRVPLKVESSENVRVTVVQNDLNTHKAQAQIQQEDGVQFVVQQGGQIHAQ